MKNIYYLVIFLFIITGCNKDDENNPPSGSEPETLIAQGADIISVSENTIIITDGITDLEINDIIVSGANANAPRGFLRKIKDINSVDGNIVLTTERTSIEEGLKYFSTTEDTLRASFSHTFTQDDGRSQSKRNFNIVLEIDETISVNGIDLNLNGNLEITPSLSGAININRNGIGLPYLETLELITQTENNLTITLTTETQLSFDEEILLGSFQASPITIYLGGFPVVVIPEVSLSVGANGQINATLTYSYNSNSTFTAGIRYDENWQFPDSNGLVVNSTSAEATAEVTGDAKIYIKPEFGISLYDEGFVNTGINIKPYARFQGTINTNGYEYGVYGGISAGAFFKASIFGFNLVNKEWDDLITIAEYEIISGTGNASTPTVTTADVSNITTTSAESGGNVTDDGGSSVTSRGICWSTSPNPTTVNNTTNNGSGLGSFISQLSGLEPNTNYYVRAYATNDVGTAYGNQLTFATQGSGSISPAYNPNPENGATNVPLNGTLSFTPGNNTPANATFKLYFGTNQNPTTSFNLGASTNFSYNNLQEDINYYWKVETISSTNQVLATSSVWNFKTILNTGGGIYVGDITFYTQQEINDFGLNNYSSVTGDIEIWGSSFMTTDPIISLLPLITLSSIGGSLKFVDAGIDLDNFEGLNNLQSVGGDLRIFGNDIDSLDPFANLITIGGNLNLMQGYNISDLTGLSNLNSIGNTLSISNFDLISNLNDLSNLDISNTTSIIIEFNDNLTDLSGIFSNVNSTMDAIGIGHNNSLLNLNFLNTITHINNNLTLSFNPSIENLDGLNNLTFVGSSIWIDYNDLLSDFCGITTAIVNGFDGTYLVSANAYNPSQQDIIDGNCSQ